MITTPKTTGLRTSSVALADDVDGLARPAGACDRRRTQFSITITRAVDDQAEVDRAQAHQAAGDAEVEHQVAGEEHRERDRQRDDQPGPEVAQEDQQDGDDQHAPLGQVAGHGADRLARSGGCGRRTAR